MTRSERLNKRIGVLMGGMSSEREISLKSGAAVLAALKRLGYQASAIDAGREVASVLRAERIELAFVTLHGRFGEDGAIQGLLEWMQIPYTGSGLLASALGMDKVASRQLFVAGGLCAPLFHLMERSRPRSFDLSGIAFLFPHVVKPVSEGSSVGVSIVSNAEEREAAIECAFQYGPRVLIEQYIDGREVHVGILGEAALGAIEICPQGKFYDYAAKYQLGGSKHIYPAPLPPTVYRELLEQGSLAHRLLGCKGISRVDFIIDKEMKPCLLELNSLPGMTETSLLPEIARGEGISFDQLVESILETASL